MKKKNGEDIERSVQFNAVPPRKWFGHPYWAGVGPLRSVHYSCAIQQVVCLIHWLPQRRAR
eukprot:7498730-Ditylum_brightwellii.AAC.1